jgi:HemY protein
MARLISFLLAVAALAAGLHWLAERPGSIVVEWQGYVAETSVFRAIVMLALLAATVVMVWLILRQIWRAPANLGHLISMRRQKRGLEALSSGIIAIGAGDRALATRYAVQARKALPNEPLTHLLRAQAAQLTGDRATARRIFEAMLASPDTQQLGLRGLFLEAQRQGEWDAARQFAEQALALNPRLAWPADALFDLQCKAEDWEGALATLAISRRYNHIDKAVANRRRAVLLAAQAQAAEDLKPDKALELALEAHKLAPDLVPAAATAGRLLAARGSTPRAARVLLRTWRLAPHPDIATAYAYVRPGDSPRDRLARVRQLRRLTPNHVEAAIALAIAAIEAREWDEARKALEPLLENRLTQRVCTLMARIEGEQHGDAGRVREWLARAVNAPRDPVWTADGVTSDHWAPVSPVTGTLDAFQWRVPVEDLDEGEGALLSAKVESLVGLARGGAALEHAGGAKTRPAAAATPGARGPEDQASPSEPAPVVPALSQPSPAKKKGGTPTELAEIPASTRTMLGGEGPGSEFEPVTATPVPQGGRKSVPEPSPEQPAKIFIPPRAPDDPGPAEGEGDGADTSLDFPTSSVKA